MGFKDVVNRVRSVFSREKHAVEQAVELSKGMSQPQSFDFSSLYGRYGMEPLLDYLRIEQELISRFTDYNEMESFPELSAALDIWADEACITGETEVPLLDGTTPTVAELYARDARNDWIYTSNPVTKEVTAGQFNHVQKIAEKVPVYRVVYEDRNGRRGWLRVTADHKFLLTNGTYCRAGDLKPGSSLMPFVRARLEDSDPSQACFSKVAATPVENHKVVEVVPAGIDDVYDLVDSQPHHNFAAGMNGEYVFVKNTQPDVLTGRTVWVESDDVGIKKLLQSLLDQTLQIDEDIWSIARNLCKYGNNFEELLVTQEGVVGLNPLPVETVRRFEREKGLLIGFAQDPSGRFGVAADDVDKALRGDSAPPPGMAVFEPWQMAHFRLMGRSRPSTYGISILEPARWLWRRLLLLEDAALIYRLCLRGDSKIWTPAGYKLIRDLSVDDEVYCYTRDGKLKRTRVTYQKHNGTDQIYRVKSRYHDIYANATHPVLVKSKKAGVDVYEYVEVQNLRPTKERHRFVVTTKPSDDWEAIKLRKPEPEVSVRLEDTLEARESLWKTEKSCGVRAASVSGFLNADSSLGAEKAVAVLEAHGYDPEKTGIVREARYSRDHAVNLPDVVDEDFARFFGFMLADGFVSCLVPKYESSWRVGFSAGEDKKTNAKYKRLFEKYIKPLKFQRAQGSKKPQVGSFYVNSGKFAEFLFLNGYISGSDKKRVPAWVFRSKPSVRRAFLEGFVDGDGHDTKDRRFKGSAARTVVELCNLDLVDDLRQLCLQLGIVCSRSSYRKPRSTHYNGKTIRSNGSHIINISFGKRLPSSQKIQSVTKVGKDEIFDIGVAASEHNFVADGVVVHNTRTPTRWIFYIDVGKLPPSQALGQIRKIKQEFTKNKFVNERGGVDLRYSPLASDENLFIPVVDGKRTTEVDLMATPEWQVMDDINYFKDKLFSAIKIPKAYLSEESDQRSRVLSLLDIRFARGVMRVQRELKNGIRKICKVHLAAIGIDPEKVNFDVFLTVPSWAYELAQIEVRNAKAEFADKVSAYLPERAIIKLIFGFSDEEIDALRKEKAEEEGGGAGGPEEPGAEGGAEGEPKKKPDQRKTGGSPIDLPGAARIAGRETEDKAYKILVEQMEKLTKSNSKLAKKFEELKSFSHELRSSMFFKGSHGSKTRAVPSFGNGGGRANPE